MEVKFVLLYFAAIFRQTSLFSSHKILLHNASPSKDDVGVMMVSLYWLHRSDIFVNDIASNTYAVSINVRFWHTSFWRWVCCLFVVCPSTYPLTFQTRRPSYVSNYLSFRLLILSCAQFAFIQHVASFTFPSDLPFFHFFSHSILRPSNYLSIESFRAFIHLSAHTCLLPRLFISPSVQPHDHHAAIVSCFCLAFYTSGSWAGCRLFHALTRVIKRFTVHFAISYLSY